MFDDIPNNRNLRSRTILVGRQSDTSLTETSHHLKSADSSAALRRSPVPNTKSHSHRKDSHIDAPEEDPITQQIENLENELHVKENQLDQAVEYGRSLVIEVDRLTDELRMLQEKTDAQLLQSGSEISKLTKELNQLRAAVHYTDSLKAELAQLKSTKHWEAELERSLVQQNNSLSLRSVIDAEDAARDAIEWGYDDIIYPILIPIFEEWGRHIELLRESKEHVSGLESRLLQEDNTVKALRQEIRLCRHSLTTTQTHLQELQKKYNEDVKMFEDKVSSLQRMLQQAQEEAASHLVAFHQSDAQSHVLEHQLKRTHDEYQTKVTELEVSNANLWNRIDTENAAFHEQNLLLTAEIDHLTEVIHELRNPKKKFETSSTEDVADSAEPEIVWLVPNGIFVLDAATSKQLKHDIAFSPNASTLATRQPLYYSCCETVNDVDIHSYLESHNATHPQSKITHIAFRWTKHVTDVSLRHMAAQSHAHLFTTNGLYLDVAEAWGVITDAGLQTFSQRHPLIQHICVGGTRAGRITDAGMKTIAYRGREVLQDVDVQRTWGKITDVFLKELAQYCPNLRKLNVSWTGGKITSDGVMSVTASCKHLMYLDIQGTKGHIHDEALKVFR